MSPLMSGDAELRVTFFPPLYLQRRIWVLDILRREHVSEIVDIGCGEGELLAVLCQPAPSLPPPSSDVLSSTSDATSSAIDPSDLDLHPMRVDGLDISSHALASAIEDTSPASANASYTRWEPLKVNMWCGGLEVFNPTFVNVECIVATEVIEHLPDVVLADFAPMILGAYHPRLLLVTTPSYTFNARFSPPGTMKANGFPDPTKRTDRVFRHHDHKFEWTVEEFREWCESVAREWGYDVDMATIGHAQEKDDWGRDKELGGASQVAVFRRLGGDALTMVREENSALVRDRLKHQTEHRLLAVHNHDAHVRAGKRVSAEEIVKAVVDKFGEWGEAELRLEEIWFVEDIGVMCGGWVEVLIEAIEGSPKFILQTSKDQRRGDWSVLLVGGRKKNSTSWSSEHTSDDTHEEVREGYRPHSHDEDVGFGWDSSIDLSWGVSKEDRWGKADTIWTSHSSNNTVDWDSHSTAAWDTPS
ncbi:hypothetical protein K503DRAFT_766992 [Rhizopogon vinicolor AM-OR11-026]|uniref:Small RNA 2'-O-methyltransferase n=1 Tax=Rhizopogon vinicolor AM-OR11-026 TaxID=1314800 RepID=A0A1B7NBA8_9AGAM|nr:hypothetical protein K503DRAFT_766992 [Rhizopogon vinicolor AM-OR11-026]